MPRVPLYDGLRVGASTLSHTRLSIPDAPDAGIQVQAQGQRLSQVGSYASKIALDMAQQAAQVKINDLMNQAVAEKHRLTYDPQEGYVHLKGEAAIAGPDGKPRAQEYQENYDKFLSGLESGLGNDLQRDMFRARIGALKQQFQSGLASHTAREYTTHAVSVSNGTIKIGQQQMALAWGDPEQIAQARKAIKSATYEKGRLQGLSAIETDHNMRVALSPGHVAAVAAAINAGQLDYAESHLRAHGAEMLAEDAVRVRSVLDQARDTSVVNAEVGALMQQHQHRIDPSDADRAFDAAGQTESNGQQFDKDGKPLASPAGAIGIAQVMPETGPEAAKLAGLEWDEERHRNDADYNYALGRAYFDEQLRVFGGDVRKAWAAYNAGPGRLKRDLKKAQAAGHPDDWLQYLPKETQDYVAKNARAYQQGAGVRAPTLADMRQALRQRPELANNPRRLEQAEKLLEKRVKEVQDAKKQREEEAVEIAMQHLRDNGGDYDALPAHVKAAVPASKVDDLYTFGNAIYKGHDRTNNALYAELEANPDKLARMSDTEFNLLQMGLSDADFRHFAQKRGQAIGKASGDKGPEFVNSSLLSRLLPMYLADFELDAKDKNREGAILRFFTDRIRQAQIHEFGRQLTEAEMAAYIEEMTLKTFTKERTWGGDYSKPLMAATVDDIPYRVKNGLARALKARGIDKPTDTQLLSAFWAYQLDGQKTTKNQEDGSEPALIWLEQILLNSPP